MPAKNPPQSEGLQTLAQAVNTIFGVKLSAHPNIKDALNSLVRNKTIPSTKEPIGGGVDSRNRIGIRPSDFDLVHNAVVLQGLFHDTRTIKKILTDSGDLKFRRRMARLAETILVGTRSVVGISLLPQETHRFVEMLGTATDLKSHRLPNPFEALPQLVLAEEIGLLQASVAQNTVLSEGDAMMNHFLAGELDQAWRLAQEIDSKDKMLSQFISLIEREHREAAEFDDLLDSLK